MARVLNLLRCIANQFGTMALFYLLLYSFGLKAAIAGSIVFVIVDGIRRLVTGAGFPKLYILTSVRTFAFGGVDLTSATPFMIKYEAVITSLVVGVSFVLGAQGSKPMMQEIAEAQTREAFPDRPDVRFFFQLLTLFWAGYFFLRAVTYFWLGEAIPIDQAMQIRPILGTVSMLVMIAISFQGRRLFALMQRMRLLPVVA
jgi:hypothetical protein